jgi:hypothetical protein
VQKRIDAAAETPSIWCQQTREIAKVCNVDHSTIVRRKQKERDEGLVQSTNGRVPRKGGGTYPATRPAPPREPVATDAELEAEIRLLMELRVLPVAPTATAHAHTST